MAVHFVFVQMCTDMSKLRRYKVRGNFPFIIIGKCASVLVDSTGY